ncbi:MAG: glycosyltransferase family protein [Bacteroidota bacterium]
MSRLNCLFIIQGEGRGHMTQALALQTMLVDAGHSVSAVLVGHNEHRRVPAFFLNKIGAPVEYFDSPNFAVDASEKSVKVWPTVTQNLRRSPEFKESLDVIRGAIDTYQPDVIINFFEPLAGIYNLFNVSPVPMVCIGHQYMYHHPVYPFSPGKWAQRMGAKYFTRLSAFGARRKLALSFYNTWDRPRLSVMPPLLRKELFELPLDQEEDFFLIYLLNQGYATAVTEWHKKYPDVKLHCFWDSPKHDEVYAYDDTLTFHQLHDTKFLDMMARCKGLICTAGFESVCEAMYLGKSILAVPVKGHVEQYWNALDLMQYGGGMHDAEFNIERLLEVKPVNRELTKEFRQWVDRAPHMFVSTIEKAANKKVQRWASV